LRRLISTPDEGVNINPSVSGDGRIVAFESTEDVAGAGGADGFRAIRANISVDPGSLFQMGRTRAVSPAISQDGSRIAFASKDDPLKTNSDGNSEIFLFNGSSLLQITNTTPGDPANRVVNGNFQPSISDDGRFVAFSSNRNITSQNDDGNLEIFIYDSIAATFAQLTNSIGDVGCSDARISGNGAKVAFIRDTGSMPSSKRDLMIQDRTSSTATVLATQIQALAMTYGRAISDDGTRVAYSGETATNASQVFFYDGRSGNVNRQVTSLGTRTTEVPLHATISGDGKRIGFATRRAVTGFSNSDASVELYIYDIPTTSFARVTSAPGEADCFDGSTQSCEVISALDDDGSIIVFNFPRVLSGPVAAGLENKSEIYATATVARPPFGTLTSILNQASLGHEPSSTKAVAPESIVAAFGAALASTTQQSQKQPNGTFPTNVAGTTVTVNGRAAQILFVSPDRVHFLVPPQTEIGNADVAVANADGFASRGTVAVLRAAPGIFTKTGDGIGEGMILNEDALAEGPFDPTGGNLRLLIFATGARNSIQTTVNLGGRIVNAESVVPSPDMPGLDEVRVRVPSDLRGAGPVNVFITSDGRDSNPVTVTFTGDPGRNVLVNEVLADPPSGIAGDANHDGVRDGAQDEFVELVNGTSNELISLSNWTIRTRPTGSTTETTRFTFASGTSLPAGEAIVVFGGGNVNPADPIFGCAQIVKATTSAGLSLTNSGLTILLRDGVGNLITQFSYGGSTGLDGGNSQSLTRSPDIVGAFVQHTQAAGRNGRAYSPGLRLNGTPFGNCPGHLTTVTIAPGSSSVTVGQTTQFTSQAFDEYGRVLTNASISFTSDNTTIAAVESVTTNSSTGVATANVRARTPGIAHIIASATDGATAVNSSQASLAVTGPSLSINDVTQNEGDSGTTTFTFTISLSTPAPVPVTFDIATEDNTATTANNDYLARSLTGQTIPAGSQTYIFEVTVTGDLNLEPTETFFVNVTNVLGASVNHAQGVGTIVTDDVPKLSVNDVSLSEGNTGTNKFTFTVSSSLPAPPGGITFDIATENGTAVSTSDYVARSLTSQSIPAGQSSYIFEVTVNGDTLVEPNETFFVKISNVSGNASINDGQGLGTITNDDIPLLVISQVYGGGNNSGATFRNDFVEIFNPGTTTVDFAVTPYSVQYAGVGSNFGSSKTNLTTGSLAPGKYFLVQESGGSSSGAELPTPDAIGTISMGSASGKVGLVVGTNALTGATCPGADGATPFNPSVGTIADLVGYGDTSGTSGHCYEGAAPAGAPSNTTADFRKFGGCQDTNNSAVDFATATPNPRNSSSAINDCTSADLQIVKTDSPDPVTIGSNITYTITVVNNGPATAQSVLVSDNLPAEVTFVSCNAPGGGVCGGNGNNRTISYASLAGAASFTTTIVARANGPHGATAINTASVSSATTDANSANDSSTSTTLIVELTPNLSINDVSLNEGNSGSTTFTFTVTLSPASSQTVTVNYATANGTATAGSDYAAIPSTQLTFLPGETTKPVNVTVNGDTVIEPDDTFTVDLNGATNANLPNSPGVGTIVNDDGAVVVVSQIYGGGGNASATYNADFVELFNRSNSALDVTNWSIQYQSAATTSGALWAVNRVCPTGTCSIAAGHYYLVKFGSGGTTGAAFISDATPSSATNIAAGAGKIALVNNLTALTGGSGSGCPSPFPAISIIDFVGYGTGAGICFEGASAASGPANNTTSISRKSNGCQDTNSNSADFNSPAAVTPRNSSSPANICP
jgi:uncharacterized protein (TIGR03437 family)